MAPLDAALQACSPQLSDGYPQDLLSACPWRISQFLSKLYKILYPTPLIIAYQAILHQAASQVC